METRAHHLVVGFFVLAVLAGLSAFVIWLGSVQITTQTRSYVIYFTGSVTGLQTGSPVRYKGVSLGRVTDVRIDPENLGQVRVAVDIPANVPIPKDSVASLELQGITGFVYVQITPGGGPPIPMDSNGLAVIPSRPSTIENVFGAAPELLERLMGLMQDVQGFFSEENRENMALILKNAQETSTHLTALTQKLEGTTDKANKLMDTLQADAKPISQNVRDMTTSMRKSSDQISALIRDNKDSVQAFAGTGLYEATLLMSEMRELVARLSKFVDNMEKNPQRALFGTKDQGVKVNDR